jgi:hypothetical protein
VECLISMTSGVMEAVTPHAAVAPVDGWSGPQPVIRHGVPPMLRDWRGGRRMSQLGLAPVSEVSTCDLS